MSGYIVGLGYKQIIQGGLYGFAEANYMGYGDISGSVTQSYTDGTPGTFTSRTSASLNAYNLLIGVGYKF